MRLPTRLHSTPVLAKIPLLRRLPNQGDLRSRCYTLMGFCLLMAKARGCILIAYVSAPRPPAPSADANVS